MINNNQVIAFIKSLNQKVFKEPDKLWEEQSPLDLYFLVLLFPVLKMIMGSGDCGLLQNRELKSSLCARLLTLAGSARQSPEGNGKTVQVCIKPSQELCVHQKSQVTSCD